MFVRNRCMGSINGRPSIDLKIFQAVFRVGSQLFAFLNKAREVFVHSAPFILLAAGDGHAVDAEGGGGGGAPEDQVVADGGDVLVHVLQVAGDGDLFDGIGEFAVFDPEAGRALGVVAGDEVDAEAHSFRDVEALGDAGDD